MKRKKPDNVVSLERLAKLPPKARKANIALAASLAKPEPAPPPPQLVELKATGSKTDLLFACPWWVGKKVKARPAGEATRFGSAFHEVMAARLDTSAAPNIAKIAARWDVAVDKLADRADEAFPVVFKWLRGDNMRGVNFAKAGLLIEKSIAYNPSTGKGREIDPPEEATHQYADVGSNEIAMTLDVGAVIDLDGQKTVLVLDHKSGWNVAADWQPQTPAENGQLRTLASALAALHGASQATVAFFHAPAMGMPEVYADNLSFLDLKKHRKDLIGALRNVGTGWMRPGPHCGYCGAFSICPTQTSSLVALKRESGALTAERVGAILKTTAYYDKLREMLRGEARAWVRQNGPAVDPASGDTYDLVEVERTNLSQASIKRALGDLKGAKEIARLERLGAIEKSKRLELRQVKR